MNIITEIDYSILDFIYENFRTTFGNIIFPFITRLGNGGVIWIALALTLLFFKNTRKLGIVILISLAVSAFISDIILKPVFHRIRPYECYSCIDILINAPKDYSFPSGHTTISFASAVPVFLRNKKWGIATLVMASLIAFSRLYLYVHYPSDILGGMVLGIIVGVITYRLAYKNTYQKW